MSFKRILPLDKQTQTHFCAKQLESLSVANVCLREYCVIISYSIGCLRIIAADYCLWNGLAMRSCCVALGTMSGHL